MEDAEGEMLRLTDQTPESGDFKAGSTEKNLTPQMMLVSSVDYSNISCIFVFSGPICLIQWSIRWLDFSSLVAMPGQQVCRCQASRERCQEGNCVLARLLVVRHVNLQGMAASISCRVTFAAGTGVQVHFFIPEVLKKADFESDASCLDRLELDTGFLAVLARCSGGHKAGELRRVTESEEFWTDARGSRGEDSVKMSKGSAGVSWGRCEASVG